MVVQCKSQADCPECNSALSCSIPHCFPMQFSEQTALSTSGIWGPEGQPARVSVLGRAAEHLAWPSWLPSNRLQEAHLLLEYKRLTLAAVC
jgi:hypothetical protein